MNIPGYTSAELLFDSERSMIYRTRNEESGKSYILKEPGRNFPLEKAKVIFQSEYAIGCKLDSDAHLKYIAYDELKGTPYLLMEDFDGVALQKLIPSKGFEIVTFFKYAIRIVSAIAQLHQKKIIHRDICPGNIAINTKTGIVKLIDFGSASDFIKEISEHKNFWTQATLAFISPEQTGRTNRLLTYKTDFYSLGVTFFQMLTGRLPFQSQEPSELIYQHIAADPPHVKEINPSIPAQLDEIVLKLMSKNPDERYNSALGLMSDLEKSLEYWNETSAIPIFPLAADDVSEVFSIPDKIYGREEELKSVREYFNRALSGQLTVCYIEGGSGIGKSAFFSELYRDIIKEKWNFGAGKFDQFQRNVPYSALIQALNQIIQQILIESPDSISKWKNILQETLGSNAGLLATVLPGLELILGEIEKVEITNPVLARNRFVIAFKNLIKSFSQPDTPLVLFLDDLQWIDAATLQLFSDFFNTLDRNEVNYTMITGAYRDNEVGPDHPLYIVLRDFEERGFPMRTIKLGPLGLDAINNLCSESLGRKPDETRELVSLLYAKTGGSPFFIKQFLENLYERGFIYLNRVNRNWTWQIDKVKEAGYTDNVVDIIQQKLHKLNPDEQLVLKIASCLGKNFDASDIVQIARIDEALVNDALIRAMEEDIIYKLYSDTSEKYLFQHDRIQNAAYTLIREDELDELHYRIGNYIIAQPEMSERSTENLFEGLGHLNRTESLVTNEALRLRLARYNLEAGDIARQSNANQAALTFAEKGIRFLPPEAWKVQHDLSRKLHLLGAQTSYLLGEFDQMHRMTDAALPNLTNPIDKANFHEIVTYSYASRREWHKTVEEALQGLAMLNLKLPRNPNVPQVLLHLAKLFITMGRRSTEDLINLPDLKDPKIEATIKLIISATSAAYLTNQNMFAIFFTEMARLSAKHGNSKYAPFAYAGFGVFFGGALGFINHGFRFGELGKKVFEKYRSDELQAKIYFSLYAFVQNWKIDVKQLYPKLLEGFQVGSQVGENEYAAWCLTMRGGMSTLSGEKLEQVEETLAAAMKYSENLKQIQIISSGFHEYATWWMDKGLPENDPMLQGFVDRRALVYISEQFWTALAEHDLIFGSMYFYHFQYEKAWEHLSRGWEHHKSLIGLFYYAQLAFYRAWCAIKLQQENPGRFSAGKLKKIIQDFKTWGVHSQANHGHKLVMFEAEAAVIKGDRSKAMDLLDEAILQAEKTDHPNDQALFCEVTARHYESWGKKTLAETYILQAYSAYLNWGALRKVRVLESEYPALKQQRQSYKRPGTTTSTVITEDIISALDVESILKASQAISSEIKMDALMVRLLKILAETAGAQRVIILLNVKGDLRIEAMKEIGHEVEIKGVNLEDFAEIPDTLIRYIEKTKSAVLLENAADKGPFTRDPFIMRDKGKSVLGIPIVRQGNLEGIIYMDNNLATGVFTPERADILSTLSAQIAISLENANFISRMQELNKSYDRFVPKEFLKMLNRDSILDVSPGDQVINEMVILFADIRGFTALCETIPASETFSILNEYLSTVTPPIHENGGTVDKFMGDGIMALFPNNADNALRAAIQMQQLLDGFNLKRKAKHEPPILIGIGLHIGKVTLGTVGTDNRLSTTVIGDPVNLASRLESHTRINKADILVSGELVARLKDPASFNLREVGNFFVKGKANKIKLFEEFSGKPPEIIELMNNNIALFSSAVEHFDKEEFEIAREQFELYLRVLPSDFIAQYYHEISPN